MNAISPALRDVSGASSEAPETDDARRARHLDMLREIAELGMKIARVAAAQALDTAPEPDAPDPSLTFTRATSSVRQAIALEARIVAGIVPTSRPNAVPARAHSFDLRRTLLRQTLHQALDAEPDRSVRNELRREIDERIEQDLCEDPEAAISACDIFIAISEDLGLRIDPSRLPSELLGLEPPSVPPAPPRQNEPSRYHQRE